MFIPILIFMQQKADGQGNRRKLIAQNCHLAEELTKMKHQVAALSQPAASYSGSEGLHSYYLQMETQRTSILNYKKKIKALQKTLNPNQSAEVRKVEDQIYSLKKELWELKSEKDTLLKHRRAQKQALIYYEPLDTYRTQIFTQYKFQKTRSNELRAELLQIEKAILRLHNLKEMRKKGVLRQAGNDGMEDVTAEQQIELMRQEILQVEEKWRPQLDELDNEYFAMKVVLEQKLNQITSVEKMERNITTRIAAIRAPEQLRQNRERLRKVSISPAKQIETRILQHNKKVSEKQEAKGKDKPEIAVDAEGIKAFTMDRSVQIVGHKERGKSKSQCQEFSSIRLERTGYSEGVMQKGRNKCGLQLMASKGVGTVLGA